MRPQNEIQSVDFTGVDISVAIQWYMHFLGHTYCRETDTFLPPWTPNFAKLYTSRGIADKASGSAALRDCYDIKRLIHALFCLQREGQRDSRYLASLAELSGLIRVYWSGLTWEENEFGKLHLTIMDSSLFGRGYSWKPDSTTDSRPPKHDTMEQGVWNSHHGPFHRALVLNNLLDVRHLLPPGWLRFFYRGCRDR